MSRSPLEQYAVNRYRQRGITTLAISLILLVILTVMVLFSTNVAYFEQRTTNNENRARLVEQAAEYSVNLAGEYLKANSDKLIANNATGWLSTGAERRWAPCADVSPMPTAHPCMAERNGLRRGQMYFYSSTGAVGGSSNLWTAASAVIPAAANLDTASVGVGGAARFPTTTDVGALLCRIDTSLLPKPDCRLAPAVGNRVAITIIGTAALAGENANATVKETWGSISKYNPMAAVPLVASGFIEGTGNVEIVAAPNAGGFGVPASIWTPKNADVDKSGGGSAASISSCQLGEFLGSVPEAELKTTCAGTGNTGCGCPAANSGSSDFLSGHVPGSSPACCENIDILDVDGGQGKLPDIQFFPGGGMSKAGVLDDDSLFEWVFGMDYVVADNDATGTTLTNCAGPANCAQYALLEDLGAEPKTCAELSSLGANADGLYYITGSGCALPAQVGKPDAPAIVVINDEATLNNTVFFGMLFVRSNTQEALLRGSGNAKVFGAVVVEGRTVITGGLTLVYDSTSATRCPGLDPTHCFDKNAKFGRIPGSWLDNRTGF